MAHEPLTYFIWDLDGTVIANGGMFERDKIGFIQHLVYWRQGYGREALHATIVYLFDTLNMPQLTANADPRNAASVGLLTALGFQNTCTAKNTIRASGEWSDSVFLRLLRDDYRP